MNISETDSMCELKSISLLYHPLASANIGQISQNATISAESQISDALIQSHVTSVCIFGYVNNTKWNLFVKEV